MKFSDFYTLHFLVLLFLLCSRHIKDIPAAILYNCSQLSLPVVQVILRYLMLLEHRPHGVVHRLPDLFAQVGHAPSMLDKEGREVAGHDVDLPCDGELLLQLHLWLRD